MLRQTHTFAVLKISSVVFEEIKQKLLEANYDHCFIDDVIDMNGIAVKEEKNDRENIAV